MLRCQAHRLVEVWSVRCWLIEEGVLGVLGLASLFLYLHSKVLMGRVDLLKVGKCLSIAGPDIGDTVLTEGEEADA